MVKLAKVGVGAELIKLEKKKSKYNWEHIPVKKVRNIYKMLKKNREIAIVLNQFFEKFVKLI